MRGYAALKLREQSYKTITSQIMAMGPADVESPFDSALSAEHQPCAKLYELELGRDRMARGGASLSAFVCQSAVLLGQPYGGACSAAWLPRNACMSCVVLESCSSFSRSTASSCEISCSMSTREPWRRVHGTIIYRLMHMLNTVCIRTCKLPPLVNPVHSNSESVTL